MARRGKQIPSSLSLGISRTRLNPFHTVLSSTTTPFSPNPLPTCPFVCSNLRAKRGHDGVICHMKCSHAFLNLLSFCICKKFQPGLTEKWVRKHQRFSSSSGSSPQSSFQQKTRNFHSKTSCDITPQTGVHSQDRFASIWRTTGLFNNWPVRMELLARGGDVCI